MKNTLLNILWLGLKEIRSLLRDTVMVLFVVYAFTFTIYTQATGTSSEVNNASIAIVDEDGSTLAKEVFGQQEAWSDAGTMTALESDTVFVAELSGEAAGFVALEQEADEVLIRHLLVSSLHEGEGVGRQLLAYA